MVGATRAPDIHRVRHLDRDVVAGRRRSWRRFGLGLGFASGVPLRLQRRGRIRAQRQCGQHRQAGHVGEGNHLGDGHRRCWRAAQDRDDGDTVDARYARVQARHHAGDAEQEIARPFIVTYDQEGAAVGVAFPTAVARPTSTLLRDSSASSKSRCAGSAPGPRSRRSRAVTARSRSSAETTGGSARRRSGSCASSATARWSRRKPPSGCRRSSAPARTIGWIPVDACWTRRRSTSRCRRWTSSRDSSAPTSGLCSRTRRRTARPWPRRRARFGSARSSRLDR